MMNVSHFVIYYYQFWSYVAGINYVVCSAIYRSMPSIPYYVCIYVTYINEFILYHFILKRNEMKCEWKMELYVLKYYFMHNELYVCFRIVFCIDIVACRREGEKKRKMKWVVAQSGMHVCVYLAESFRFILER